MVDRRLLKEGFALIDAAKPSAPLSAAQWSALEASLAALASKSAHVDGVTWALAEAAAALKPTS